MTELDKKRFESICLSVAAEGLDAGGIGTMSEKRMHKALKRYICPEENYHEIRIKPDGSVSYDENDKSGRGGYIADIYSDGKIFEVQTGSFYPLQSKIKFYLENTDFDVTVVHPIIAVKWSVWVDPETGEAKKRRRSPKKEDLYTLLPEIFWLSEYLDNPRLNFRGLVIEAEEYRMLDGWSRDKKKGSSRYERMPISLIDDITVNSCEIGKRFLPEELSEEFTASDFGRITKLKGKKLYGALKVLCAVDAIEKGEKKGRSYVYRRTV